MKYGNKAAFENRYVKARYNLHRVSVDTYHLYITASLRQTSAYGAQNVLTKVSFWIWYFLYILKHV